MTQEKYPNKNYLLQISCLRQRYLFLKQYRVLHSLEIKIETEAK